MKKLTRIQVTDAPVGKVLCDMHHGTQQFPTELEVRTFNIPYMWALHLIKMATKASPDNPYTPGTINKYLYVIWQSYIAGEVNTVCTYVYDGSAYLVVFKGDWDLYEAEDRAKLEAEVAYVNTDEGFAQYKREDALMKYQAKEEESE